MKRDGILYQKPCAVLLRVENDQPVFGRLEEIFIVNNRILLHVSLLHTCTFDNHLQAYIINTLLNSEMTLPTQLYSPFPMHIHRVTSFEGRDVSVIVCKHHICSIL